METILRNFRYAARRLRKSPEFTVVAVFMLALGIGANTAMFTVIENVLLRPLPYANPERLVSVGGSRDAVSWLDYLDIRGQARTLANAAGYSTDVAVVQGKDATLSVTSSAVTPNLFTILGAQPLRGRTFTAVEGQPNGPRAVLISEGLWRQLFAADPAVVGRTLRVNGEEHTIVGVMPASFRFPESVGADIEKALWLPMQPTPEMLRERGFDSFTILGKAAPGVSISEVQAELGVIAKLIREIDPHSDPALLFRAQPYLETVTGPVREVLLALSAAVGLVLLIVCANVASLLIARCLASQHEFALRTTLGCGPRHLIGQVLCEAGMLSAFGSALGILVAYWITAAMHSLPPGTIPRAETIEMRWTVMLLLAGIATMTTVLSALLPAIVVAKSDPQISLRTGSRSTNGKSFRTRITGSLVGAEVALSMLLVIAAGLLFRTLWSLEHARLGFETTNVTSFVAMPPDAAGFGNSSVNSSQTPTPSVAMTRYQPLLEALRHAPGFQEAALVSAPPFSGLDFETGFRVLGWPAHLQQGFQARLTALSGRYHELMRTPVIRGRSINDTDAANQPFIATINEALARKYFAGKDPLGQQLSLGGRGTGMIKPYTIVGIISDEIDNRASEAPQPLIMLPYQQIPTASLFYAALLQTAVHFVVRTQGATAAAPGVRAVFRRVAPDLALSSFQTMQEAVDQSNFGSRISLYLIAAFAGLAVLLVATGLYGVLSQVVNQRRRELGLRVALGAPRHSVARHGAVASIDYYRGRDCFGLSSRSLARRTGKGLPLWSEALRSGHVCTSGSGTLPDWRHCCAGAGMARRLG